MGQFRSFESTITEMVIVLLMTNTVKLLLLYCEFSKLIQRDLGIQPCSRL